MFCLSLICFLICVLFSVLVWFCVAFLFWLTLFDLFLICVLFGILILFFVLFSDLDSLFCFAFFVCGFGPDISCNIKFSVMFNNIFYSVC